MDYPPSLTLKGSFHAYLECDNIFFYHSDRLSVKTITGSSTYLATNVLVNSNYSYLNIEYKSLGKQLILYIYTGF